MLGQPQLITGANARNLQQIATGYLDDLTVLRQGYARKYAVQPGLDGIAGQPEDQIIGLHGETGLEKNGVFVQRLNGSLSERCVHGQQIVLAGIDHPE